MTDKFSLDVFCILTHIKKDKMLHQCTRSKTHIRLFKFFFMADHKC